MKVNEDILREVLREALADASKNKNFIEQFKVTMHHMYNITGGEVIDILNGKSPVELMSQEMMFKITNVLYELNKHLDNGFDVNLLDIDKYFTERDKVNFSQKIDRTVTDDDITIPSGKWIQVEDDQYVIVIPVSEAEKWVTANKLRYNPETQRELTLKETKTGVVKVITWFPKAFEAITDLLKNNLFISDALTFNINPDRYEPPKVLRGNLVIPKDSVMDCIDGFHRFKSYITVKRLNAGWNKNIIINLMSFDKDKAVRYILQEDKKNHLSEAQATKSNQTDAANFIINKLKDSTNFYLKDTIVDEYVLNIIINEIFKPKKLLSIIDRPPAVELANIIEKNINNLVEFKNDYRGFKNEEWFVYLYILKYVIDNNLMFLDIVQKIDIERLLQEIIFTTKPTTNDFRTMKEVIKNV